MKAFLVGLIFLIAVGLLGIIGFLLFPFIVVLTWFLRILVAAALVIFAIWLLGKFIIYVWEQIRTDEEKKENS